MKKTLSLLSLTTVVLAGSFNLAQADGNELTKDVYLAPFGSFVQPGGDSAGLGGWGTGLGVGKVLNQHFNVELRGFWQNYHNDLSCCGGAETDLVGATADLQYYFLRDTFSPYAVVSAGGMTSDIQGPALSVSQESFVFEAGIGSTYSIYKQLMLRGDVRYRLNTLPDSLGQDGVLNDAVVNLGFVVPLGL